MKKLKMVPVIAVYFVCAVVITVVSFLTPDFTIYKDTKS